MAYTKKYYEIQNKLLMYVEETFKKIVSVNSIEELDDGLAKIVLDFAINLESFKSKLIKGEFDEIDLKNQIVKNLNSLNQPLFKEISVYASNNNIRKAELVSSFGFDIKQDTEERDIKVINEYIDDFCKSLAKKILSSDSLASFSKEESKFILSLGTSLEHVKEQISNNVLTYREFKTEVYRNLYILNKSIYGRIKRFGSVKDTYASKVKKFGYDIETENQDIKMRVIARYIEEFIDKEIDKIMNANSIEDLTNYEKTFVLSLGANLSHVQNNFKNGQLDEKEFKSRLVKRISSMDKNLYYKIMGFANGRSIEEVISLLGYASSDTTFKNQRVKEEVRIYIEELQKKILNSNDIQDLNNEEQKLVIQLRGTLKDLQKALISGDVSNEQFETIVMGKLSLLNKNLYGKVTRIDGEKSYFEIVKELGYVIIDKSIKPREERILILQNRIENFIKNECNRIENYIRGENVELSEYEKNIVNEYLEGRKDLRTLVINGLHGLDNELYLDIKGSTVLENGGSFVQIMRFLGYSEYQDRKYGESEVYVRKDIQEYLSNNENINQAKLELINNGVSLEEITTEQVREYLINNLRRMNLSLYKRILSLGHSKRLSIDEAIKEYSGYDYTRKKNNWTKDELRKFVLDEINNKENRARAIEWFEDKKLDYDDMDIENYIVENIRILNPEVYRRVDDTFLFGDVSVAEKFIELGFTRRGNGSRMNVSQHFARLAGKQGLASCRDNDGYVDSYRENTALATSISALSVQLSIPYSLVVMLIFKENLENFYINTDYLAFTSNILKEYLMDNKGNLNGISHKNPSLYKRLTYIANRLYTGEGEPLSIDSVVTLLAEEYANQEVIDRGINDSETFQEMDNIKKFIYFIKETYGDKVKGVQINEDYKEEMEMIYGLSNRLGCSVKDLFDMYGIDYIAKTYKRTSLSRIKAKEYPYLEEMRRELDELVKGKIKNLSNEEDVSLYLDLCRQVYQKYASKIEEAEFSLTDNEKCKRRK